MREFTEALKAAFEKSPALRAAFPGGFYADLAPENTRYPCLTYSVPACPTTLAYGGETAYRPTVRFASYGSRDLCGPNNDAFALVDAVLAEGLEVPGRVIDWYMPAGRPIARLVGKARDGGDLWTTVVTYDYSVS